MGEKKSSRGNSEENELKGGLLTLKTIQRMYEHSSGSCRKWQCFGTVTINDVKRETLHDLERKLTGNTEALKRISEALEGLNK